MRLIYIIFFFIITSNAYGAFTIECKNLIDQLKNTSDRKMFYDPEEEYNHFGFDLEYTFKNEEWVLDRDPQNYPKVGRLTYLIKNENIKTKDLLIKIDDIDLKDLDEQEIRNLIYENEKDQILLTYKRDKKVFEETLNKQSFFAKEPDIDFAITNINSISQINSSFNADIFLSAYVDFEVDSEDLPFAKLAFDNFVFLDEKGEYEWSACEGISLKDDPDGKILPNPGEYVQFKNAIKIDDNLYDELISIYPFSHDKLGDHEDFVDLVRVNYYVSGNFSFKNDFNLQNFPFDKQVLKFKIENILGMGSGHVDFDSYTISNLDNLELNLNGWKYLGYQAENVVYEDVSKTYDLSGMEISISVQREPGYYVFKVILPILLILVVCWSVIWINPEELESKLTITIVCLLSLIAYNFVIDSELPKLDYLTILDWIILISYVYATIPNFLSIITFRLYKVNKIALIDIIDKKSKLYGLTSYIILILFIIFLNVNLNPEYTSTFFSWMSAR